MLDRLNRTLFSKYKAMKLLADSPIKILIMGVLALSTVLIWWAISYRIKATSSGIGITVNQGFVKRAYTPIEGRIVKVNVELGDSVAKGDVIAEIDSTKERIKASSSSNISALSDRLTPDQIRAKAEATKRKIVATKKSMVTLNDQIEKNLVLAEKMFDLLSTGNISNAEYLTQLKIVDDLRIQAFNLEGEIEEYETDLFDLTQKARVEQMNDMADAALANYDLRLTKEIEAPATGLISLIDVSEGNLLKEGDTVAQVSYKTGPIKGVFLMSAEMAKRIKTGDKCLISPAESPPERYGYVEGIAETIGKLPTNPGEFERRIGLDYTTQQLFDQLSRESTGSEIFKVFPYLVTVNINMKDNNATWTTGIRPPWGFEPGGAATVQCIYDIWSPMSYVIPFFRREAGYTRSY